MIMDMLRTPDQNLARMVADSGEEFWVRWFKAAPDARPFPYPHAFGSQYWEWNPDFEGPGMIKEPIEYVRQRYPAPPGLHFHGMAEWFLDGMPRELLDLDPITDSCGVPTQDPRGGVVLGGTAEQTGTEVILTLIVTKRVETTLTTPGVLPLNADDVAILLTSTEPLDMLGIDQGVNGRIVILRNIGDFPISFLHQDPSPPAGARIICLDQVSARLYPRMEIQFEWSDEEERWTEIRSIPYLQQKGDLITHDETEPHVLHTSGTDGNVLTEDSSDPLGVAWKPPSNKVGADWWYWPPGATGDADGLGWTQPANVFGGFAVNENIIADQVIVLPLPRPRGGTIDKVGFYSGGGILPVSILVGFYTNVDTTGICYPGELIQFEEVTVSAGNKSVFTLSTPLTLEAGQLLWVAFLCNNAADLASITSVSVQGVAYPVFGYQELSTSWAGPLCGVGLGIDGSGMGPGDWPYGDGLPETFPDPSDSLVSFFSYGGFPTLPAIMLHHSG